MTSEGINVPVENKDWHGLFWEFKKRERDGKPAFLGGLVFVAVPNSKVPYLSDFFHALNI